MVQLTGVFWSKQAEKTYIDYLKSSPHLAHKIQILIDDIMENGLLVGLGKPEPLKHYDPPKYSRHIDRGIRLIYSVRNTLSGSILWIDSCDSHYDDH